MNSGVPTRLQPRRDWFRLGVNSWMLLVVGFLLAPSAVVLVNSLGQERFVKFPPSSLTLQWYGEIPRSFMRAFATSLEIGILVAVGGCILGVPTALAIVRGKVPGRRTVDAFLRSPIQVPWLVTGVAFLNYYRLIRDLTGIGLINSLLGLMLAHLIIVAPYVFTTVAARLTTFDDSVEEAAAGLGASRWTTFWKVTFPIISPAIFAGAFMAFILSFDNVPVSIFLAGTDVTTFPVALYFSLEFELSRMQYAAATLATVFSTVLVLAVHRWLGDAGATSYN